MSKNVNILVVPETDMLEILGDKILETPFLNCEENKINLLAEKGIYKFRPDMEKDPSFKQLIPYILCNYNGNILSYKRSSNGGEDRLHNLYSIGVGGHIDENKESTGNFYQEIYDSAIREIEEELGITIEQKQLHFVGYLYDYSTEVNKVHLGIIMVLDLNYQQSYEVLHNGEQDILENREFVSLEELEEMNLEPWSKITLEYF